jgi:hypothetical protein
VVDPDAVVVHRQELDLVAFWRKRVTYGHGAYRFRSAHGLGWRDPSRFYADLLRGGLGGGLVVGAFVLPAQLATVIGFVREAAGQRFAS